MSFDVAADAYDRFMGRYSRVSHRPSPTSPVFARDSECSMSGAGRAL
jgi:hypothetical protein